MVIAFAVANNYVEPDRVISMQEGKQLGLGFASTFSGGRVSVIVSCSPDAPCTGYRNL